MIIREFRHHLRYIVGCRQFPSRKNTDRYLYILKVHPRTFEEGPVYKRCREIRQNPMPFRACEDKYLRADCSDGQATDPLLPQHRPF